MFRRSILLFSAIRAARPNNREALRKAVRVRFTLVFLTAAVISVPATLLLL